MHHADKTQSGKQENQRVPQTEVIVDRPEQHDDKHQGVKQPARSRQDEDAPLIEHDGQTGVRPKLEQPVLNET